ncbi:MAG: hypothetical protein ACRDXE_04695 [Acidimicrobiales bacterium]
MPPDVGLLASLEVYGDTYLVDGEVEETDGTDIPQRWVGGYRYLPEQYAARTGALDPCALQSATEFMDVPASPGLVEVMPYVVWAGDRCSAIGFPAHDYQGRAQRALEASESFQIAHELWTGKQARASGWPNPYLASAAAIVMTAAPVASATALALLEQGLAETSNGQRAMIHCTREMGSALSELGNTFRSVNGLIITYMGTIICPDAGYPGTGPAGQPNVDGSQWAYATLMPTVRRSPIEILPETFEEATDRSVNEIDWRSLRYATAVFPPGPLVAVQVNLPAPLGVGAS